MERYNLSNSFVKRRSVAIRRKFPKSVGSRFCFFKRGLITECFKQDGNTPVLNKLSIIYKTARPIAPKTSLKSQVGIRSAGEDDGFTVRINSIRFLRSIRKKIDS